MNGAKYISSMDMAGAYHQVPIRECDKEKTAFRTPDGGLWQYTVVPFGLVNLPAQFSRLMHKVLRDTLDKYSAVYIDYVLVYDHSIEEHIAHIREACLDAFKREACA
jgi:Reverse transcriptase (RNA-dependent DNA polymerase)